MALARLSKDTVNALLGGDIATGKAVLRGRG